MKSLTVFILFSLFMITLVAMSIIPQMIIPEDDNGSSIFAGKSSTSAAAVVDKKNYAVPGKNNECDLQMYDMDCKIAAYLEENLLNPVKGGRIFCAYEQLGQSDSADIKYINFFCQEFYVSEDKIRQGSGSAGPAKVIVSDNGSLTHWVPRDGSYFTRDINEFFPKEHQAAAFGPNSEKLAQMNRERARIFFAADFNYQIEKNTQTVCVHDFECATPGEYLMMSRCPFTSACLDNKCAVICPDFRGIK